MRTRTSPNQGPGDGPPLSAPAMALWSASYLSLTTTKAATLAELPTLPTPPPPGASDASDPPLPPRPASAKPGQSVAMPPTEPTEATSRSVLRFPCWYRIRQEWEPRRRIKLLGWRGEPQFALLRCLVLRHDADSSH